jgi:lipopolysaccharide/colanic/teichoic acid biosynthesis glycosyltransferase
VPRWRAEAGPAAAMFKRAFDVVAALVGLLVFGLPMLAAAAWIRLDSPGPVFFRQERVGRHGRRFRIHKFRTMAVDAEQRGPQLTVGADARVTRAGRLLRANRLDELPQFLDVLAGDMSWVGPRPPIPAEVEQYTTWQLRRLEITPGLTGLWQVSGRSELAFDDMVKLDLFYAENWSLAFDIKIILMTIPAVLKARGAY